MKLTIRWDSRDLVVLRGDEEVDRIAAIDIQRVILVCSGGDTPADLDFALIETPDEHVLLPAASGIAGRLYFDRQPYWTERACIYWVTGKHAALPRHIGHRIWPLRRNCPPYLRLPTRELASLIEQWQIVGPQTWEQRKWARAVSKRHLAAQARSLAPSLS